VRKQDWAGITSGFALAASVAALTRRRLRRALALLGIAVAADSIGRVWSRRRPGPIPASLRWVLYTPHPAGPLRRALAPRPGERVLEVGPGLGHYAVQVAQWVHPDGALDVLDVQQEMLDATMRRANERGIDNITPALADASGHFPYDDATFNAAYLNGVLGEIPDQQQALSELHRVLKRGGRLVVGEIGIDPDFVPPGQLRQRCEAAGLRFDRREGPRLAYFARFVAT